jgi:chemotaxis protein methyltransferase CheR
MTTKSASATGFAPADLLPLEQFIRFRDLIEDRCGLHFDESQRPSLSASLRARMQQLGLERLDDYFNRLRARPADDGFRKLINLVTITETCFFRDESQFRLLRRHILPTLLAERAGQAKPTLRIWSAGCSSGEEAYSIALLLWDMGLHLKYPDWTFEIVGTDVNTEVLDAANRGVYSARALRNVEGDWLRRYFRPDGPHFRLNDEVRRGVRFEYGNLTQAPLPRSSSGHDIVFCKNVAIYFRPEMTRRLVRGLHESLADGGYLLLGHSESLWQMAEGFALVEHEGAFCYRKTASDAEAEGRRDPKPVGRSRSAGAPTKTAARRVAGRRRATPPPIEPPSPAGPNAAAELGTQAGHPNAAPRVATAGQYELCLRAFRAGEWKEAETSLDDLIRSTPTFLPAHLLLGGVYAHRGRYEEARAQAERVLLLSDLEPRAHLLLGMIAARRGRLDEALQALRRVLYLDDSLALAHFWLGNLYRDRGDIERACHEYQNVIRDWDRHTLDLTEEFASDLSAEQLVNFCRSSLQRLRPCG